MKLKEIKSGMAIHCTSKEQVQYLVSNGLAVANNLNMKLPIWISVQGEKTPCYYGYMPEKNARGITGKEYYKKVGYECVEFSDLIIQELELSAEDALLAYDQMCRENYCCNDCPIYGIVGDECTHKMEGHITEIVDAIKKWKADHEKTEPEIETKWFWHGRIYYVSENGSYFPLKGNEGAYDTGCECREMAEKYMADVLKEYCKTHEGNYVAKVEHVCRVKAVE